MGTPAKKQLIDLHQTLYKQAYEDAIAYAKGSSKILLDYSSRFEANLPDTFKVTTHEHVLSSILKSNIVLFGDFHTLKQSQRGLLRVLRSLKHKKRRNPDIILALEAFKCKDQKFIDEFLESKISEESFLIATNYKEDWGFPWAHFKIFFEFAKENKIKVIGINSDRSGKDSLKVRDNFSANVLIDCHLQNRDKIIVCLIGEYHLADAHLPKDLQNQALKKNIPLLTTRIFTNIDKYFFQLPTDKPSMTTEYLHLQDNMFCIMNSPPWMKWQSYTIWEELRNLSENEYYLDDEDEEDEYEFFTEQTFDVDYQFLMMLKSLVKFLQVKVDDNALSNFSIHEFIKEDLIKTMQVSRSKYKLKILNILERANLDGFYFIDNKKNILLTTLSINNLAEATGQFLHHIMTKATDHHGDMAERFYTRVLRTAAGMIAAKILNPRRKCLNLLHFNEFLKQNNKKKLTGHPLYRRKCATAVLKFHELMANFSQNQKVAEDELQKICALDIELSLEISRSIGLILGNCIYTNVMTNKSQTEIISNFFSISLLKSEQKKNALVDFYKQMLLKN